MRALLLVVALTGCGDFGCAVFASCPEPVTECQPTTTLVVDTAVTVEALESLEVLIGACVG